MFVTHRSFAWAASVALVLPLLLAACTAPPPESAYAVLTPNYREGFGQVTVLLPDDLVDGGAASTAWYVSDPEDFGVAGLTLGPDGRLYVTDYDNDRIYIVDRADATEDGLVTPVATIESEDLGGPQQGSFDALGRFWMSNFTADTIVRFDDLQSIDGSEPTVTLTADLVLTVDVDGGTFAEFSRLYQVLVDAHGDVWAADHGSERVYRFDEEDVGDLSGVQSVVPSLQLSRTAEPDVSSNQSITSPQSIAVADDGTLYVGNGADHVSRFDGASSLVGVQAMRADAYLSSDDENAWAVMVALDAGGALWIGYATGGLVKIADPGSYDGAVKVWDDAAPFLTWAEDGATEACCIDGGTPVFVPVPR